MSLTQSRNRAKEEGAIPEEKKEREGEKNRVQLSPVNVAAARGIVWLWVARWSLPWKTIHERSVFLT